MPLSAFPVFGYVLAVVGVEGGDDEDVDALALHPFSEGFDVFVDVWFHR